MTPNAAKTVAIIGAGPTGLAAAAHALERGLEPIVLERGSGVGHAVRDWSHVRSIVADISGDRASAERVELELPETGVCSRPLEVAANDAGCCGGPAPTNVDACCVMDAEAKAAGAKRCGCGG